MKVADSLPTIKTDTSSTSISPVVAPRMRQAAESPRPRSPRLSSKLATLADTSLSNNSLYQKMQARNNSVSSNSVRSSTSEDTGIGSDRESPISRSDEGTLHTHNKGGSRSPETPPPVPPKPTFASQSQSAPSNVGGDAKNSPSSAGKRPLVPPKPTFASHAEHSISTAGMHPMVAANRGFLERIMKTMPHVPDPSNVIIREEIPEEDWNESPASSRSQRKDFFEGLPQVSAKKEQAVTNNPATANNPAVTSDAAMMNNPAETLPHDPRPEPSIPASAAPLSRWRRVIASTLGKLCPAKWGIEEMHAKQARSVRNKEHAAQINAIEKKQAVLKQARMQRSKQSIQNIKQEMNNAATRDIVELKNYPNL